MRLRAPVPHQDQAARSDRSRLGHARCAEALRPRSPLRSSPQRAPRGRRAAPRRATTCRGPPPPRGS
eukprot:4394215-Pyramimonas_sp.AAC.1